MGMPWASRTHIHGVGVIGVGFCFSQVLHDALKRETLGHLEYNEFLLVYELRLLPGNGILDVAQTLLQPLHYFRLSPSPGFILRVLDLHVQALIRVAVVLVAFQ